MRNYEGSTNLQGLGEIQGIQAKNLQVGDMQVFNYGSLERIEKIETTKTGKTIIATYKRFNKMAKLVNGQWVGEYQEFTRKFRATSIVIVNELNPVVEEIEIKEEPVEIIDNVKNNISLEELLMKSLKIETRKLINSDKIRKLNLELECDLAYIRCKFKRLLNKINEIKIYSRTNELYSLINSYADNWKGSISKEEFIKNLRKLINNFNNRKTPVLTIELVYEGDL